MAVSVIINCSVSHHQTLGLPDAWPMLLCELEVLVQLRSFLISGSLQHEVSIFCKCNTYSQFTKS